MDYRLTLRRDAAHLIGKWCAGQGDTQRFVLRGQAQDRIAECYDLSTRYLCADTRSLCSRIDFQAPERILVINYQVDTRIEIRVTHTAVHRYRRVPPGRVVADEIADGGGQRIERLNTHVRVAAGEGKHEGDTGRRYLCTFDASRNPGATIQLDILRTRDDTDPNRIVRQPRSAKSSWRAPDLEADSFGPLADVFDEQ